MRILVFAPNGGASLSTGGGVNFVLKQADALVHLGHSVTLAGFHALSREQLEQIHSVALPSSVGIFPGAATAGYGFLRAVPVKFSAYNALFDPRFPQWIRTAIERVRPDAVWFHDDIPQAALAYRADRRFYLYVHYPLAGRDPRVCPELARTAVEAANDGALHALSGLVIVEDPFEVCEGVWTNSTVTSRVVHEVWGRPGEYLPTYVVDPAAEGTGSTDSRTIVAVGAFSPGKHYGTLIEGFARARAEGWRLQIAGHERDRRYLGRLRKLVRQLNVERTVELCVSPSRDALRSLVAQGEIAVQAARFEPFGLSLLEAMAEGLGPISHRGPFSGSWVDILLEGQFGRGFVGAEELSATVAQLAQDPSQLERLKGNGRARAKAFNRATFLHRFEEIHGVIPGAASA